MWFRNKELLTFLEPATLSSQQQRAYFLVWTGGNPGYNPQIIGTLGVKIRLDDGDFLNCKVSFLT